MTPYTTIYEMFLSKILDDEWTNWDEEDIEIDLRQILEGAIPWFKFPRTSLERNDQGFLNVLSQEEIQILAAYMKCEWLNRAILTWENIKPLCDERDFSPANLLDKLTKAHIYERQQARILESHYYRAVDGKPFNYARLAGVDNG